MKIDKNTLNIIRESIRISDIIGNFIPITRKGKNYVCVCPFHDDKNPSLVVNDAKNIFKCFACGQSGDAFSFVSKFKNISYYEAIIECAKISQVDERLINYAIKFNDEFNKFSVYYEINKHSNNFFKKFINTQEGEKAKQYLHDRCFSDDDIDKFELGWAPHKNVIYDLLTNKDNCSSGKTNFNHYEIQQIGLCNQSNNDNANFFFKNRITFPIYDENNNLVGFSGRSIDPNDEPKYLNSSESLIFHKNEILFNLNNVIKNVDVETIYIVEGFMDVFAFRRLNVENVVATMGVAFTKNHLDILKSRLPNLKAINIFYDNDNSGRLAIDNTIKIINNNFMIFIGKYLNDQYKDIDEIYRNDKELALNVINNLISLEEYQIDNLINKYQPLNQSNKILLINSAIDILKKSQNDIAISECVRKISPLCDIDEGYILNKILTSTSNKKSKYPTKKYNYNVDVDIGSNDQNKDIKSVTIDDLETTILQFIIADRNSLNLFQRKRFLNPDNESILNGLLSFYANNKDAKNVTIADLPNIFSKERLISRASSLILDIEKNKISNSQKALEQTINTYFMKLNKRWQEKQIEKIRNSNDPNSIIKQSIERNRTK